jgi:magnesium transporter
MMGVVTKVGASQERPRLLYQDVADSAESYLFYADQLLDETQGLLGDLPGGGLAPTSQRGDVVLTVFSAFFLPLTFIVGVYGMNPSTCRSWARNGVIRRCVGMGW